MLRLTVFGSGRLGTPLKITPATLPGTLILRGLDPATADFRVLVDGLDPSGNLTSQGAARVPLLPDRMANAGVLLMAGALPDRDGDGVPDAVDDCPDIYDPDQHGGCVGVDLSGGGNPDLSTGANPDLRGAPSPDLLGAPQPDLATGPDLAAPPVCPPGALFCDDFESGNTSRWTQPIVQPSTGATLAASTAQARHGIYSLHSIASYTPSEALSYEEYDWGGTAAPLAIRFSVYLPSAPPSGTYVAQLTNGSVGFAIGTHTSGNGTWAILENQGPTLHPTPQSVAIGAWTCIELVVNSNNTVEIFFNGAPTPAHTFTRITSSVAYNVLGAGADRPQGSGPQAEMYIDDVAMATSRLYCP
jgi:hypothetical protein